MTSSLMQSADEVYFAAGGSNGSCRLCLALPRSAAPHAVLSTRDKPASIRKRRTDANSDPVTPPSGRHVSAPSLSPPSPSLPLLVASCERVFSITRLSVFATLHAHRARCASGLTDRNYGLLNITGFISKVRQESGRSADSWGRHVCGLTSPSYGFHRLDFQVLPELI